MGRKISEQERIQNRENNIFILTLCITILWGKSLATIREIFLKSLKVYKFEKFEILKIQKKGSEFIVHLRELLQIVP